jgi:hypothetical protein
VNYSVARILDWGSIILVSRRIGWVVLFLARRFIGFHTAFMRGMPELVQCRLDINRTGT